MSVSKNFCGEALRRSRTILTIAALCVAAVLTAAAHADAVEHRLPDLVVSASGTAHELRDAPAAVSVVSREEIEAKGAENVIDAIRDTTGVNFIGQGLGGRTAVSLRGMNPDHTLFLVNGLRLIGTDSWIGHSDYQFDWTPIDGVERIEVVRGPMSVLYGSDALGGVVNVITARPADRWQGDVRVGGGAVSGSGGDFVSGGFNASGPITDTLRIGLSASKLYKSPLKLKEDPRVSEIEGKDVEAANILLSWQPVAAHTIDLEYRISQEERWRDNTSRTGVVHRDYYDIDRDQKIATWNAAWGPANTRLRVWESEFDVSNRRTNNVAPTRPQSMTDRAVDGKVDFGVGRAHWFTVGGELRKEEMENAGLLPDGKDDATFKSVYVQDEISLAEPLLLTVGVRYDHHSIFGDEVSPRAYLVWHATRNWTLRGGYGEGFRAPTLKQASPNYEGAEGPHTFFGNADIKAETSRTYEGGVAYWGDRFDWEATVFHTDVKDLIGWTQIGVEPGPPPRTLYLADNTSEARIRGIESSFSWALPAGFVLGGNATLLDPENRETGDKLRGRPLQRYNARLGWKGGPVGAGVRFEHVGRQVLGTAAAPETAPDYQLWHANVSYDITGNLRLTGGVDNIANKRLREESPLFTSLVEQPRTVRLALRGSF